MSDMEGIEVCNKSSWAVVCLEETQSVQALELDLLEFEGGLKRT